MRNFKPLRYREIWFVGIAALLTTAISCVLIFTQLILDGIERKIEAKHEVHGLMNFFISFGVILFAFGGASTFPTIQNDMIHRENFSISVCIGYLCILLIYLPVAVGGYWVYGDETHTNILLSLKRTSLVTVANLLLAFHFIMALLIMINPVSQEVENLLDIPQKFGLKRCITRCGIVCLMVFAGESVPEFGKILALIGASTVTLMTFILPNLMYIILCNQEHHDFKKRYIPWYLRIYMFLLIGVGVFGGVVSTYSAVVAIFSSETFTKPCYLSLVV